MDVVAVAESPSALFAATRDGLYRTDDLGGSWRKVNAETWSSLRSDPSSASTLYATNDGVFKSVDGGLHFSEVDRGLVATSVSSLARSPSGGLYAGAGNEVFRSTDSGSTWSRATVTSSGGVNAVLADPAVPGTVYAGTCSTSAPVLRSLDSGATWAPFSSGVAGTCVYALAAQPGTGGAHFVATKDGVSRLVSGIWQPVETGHGPMRTLLVDPVRPEVVWAGGDSGLFRSGDGGTTWSDALLTKTIASIASDPREPHTLYVGTPDALSGPSEGVLKTTDDGATWRTAAVGLPLGYVFDILVDPARPTTVYAATLEGVFRSVNGGLGWALVQQRIRFR